MSFHDRDEIRDYEKESAIENDGELKKKSKFKKISTMNVTEDEMHSKFKKLVVKASQTTSLHALE